MYMERDGADGSMRPERSAEPPWSCRCGVCVRPSSGWRGGIFTPASPQPSHCGNMMRVARALACRWATLGSWVGRRSLGCLRTAVGRACTTLRRRAPVARTPRTHVHWHARHFLDDKGAIAPLRGPAKAMADFHAGVIAYATDFDDAGVTLPRCFKCKKGTVEAALAQDDAIVWHCPGCLAEGRISNWQGTLWDLSERPDTAS